MRQPLVLLHRWAGLFMAVFLFISGLTGAVISWDHELDEWLNPQLFKLRPEADANAPPLSPLDLANRIEAADTRVLVTFVPLHVEAGHTLGVSVMPRIDSATGEAYPLDFNQLAIDPTNGDIQGRRFWGAISLARENLLPFLYKLHYSMHIPDGFGVELGMLFMGIVGIVWVLDCFIALWISFPNWRSWRKSFAFRWRQGSYKRNFDLHRSGGVWVWILLLVLAVTSVSMNLGAQVVRPIVAQFSALTPMPWDTRVPNPPERPIMPQVSREQIIERAQTEAQQRGWQTPLGSVFYSVEFGFYGASFHEPDASHGDGGLGNNILYFDGADGRALGALEPGTGSAGDIFMQAQFPLHSGRIIGIPGRVIVSISGLLVAMLSVTGVVIWMNKRRARVKSELRSAAYLANS